MLGCCIEPHNENYIDYITVDKYTYCVTINYCKNCGELKATTNVREVRDDNKTKH